MINIENDSTWDQVGRQIINSALFVLGKEDFVCVARLSENCIYINLYAPKKKVIKLVELSP
jgi:hypothetical protein